MGYGNTGTRKQELGTRENAGETGNWYFRFLITNNY